MYPKRSRCVVCRERSFGDELCPRCVYEENEARRKAEVALRIWNPEIDAEIKRANLSDSKRHAVMAVEHLFDAFAKIILLTKPSEHKKAA